MTKQIIDHMQYQVLPLHDFVTDRIKRILVVEGVPNSEKPGTFLFGASAV